MKYSQTVRLVIVSKQAALNIIMIFLQIFTDYCFAVIKSIKISRPTGYYNLELYYE